MMRRVRSLGAGSGPLDTGDLLPVSRAGSAAGFYSLKTAKKRGIAG